jgi:hypothetical protein
VNGREPRQQNERNDWTFWGFLHSVLGDGPRFARLVVLLRLVLRMLVLLVTLVVALLLSYLLAKGDVIAWYYHLTPHVTDPERWGILSGGIGAAFAGIKFRGHRKRVKRRREVEEARQLAGSGRAAEPEPQQSTRQQDGPVAEPGSNQGQSGGGANPDSDSRPAGEPR